MQAHRIPAALIALTAITVLASAGTASAHYYLPRSHQRCRVEYKQRTVKILERHHGKLVRRHGNVVWVKQVRCYHLQSLAKDRDQTSPATAQPPLPPPSIIGVGNTPGCLEGADPTAYLQEYNATVLHVVVTPIHGADGSALPCVQAAIAAGYKVHLAIAYDNTWTPAQDASFFEQVLSIYAADVWAISIGNEQDGQWNDGNGESGAQYGAVWRAVEPIVAQLAPNAIRVAGEISPWGASEIEAAVTYVGLPGVQVIAAHAYDTTGCFDLPQFVAWVHSLGLPVWFTEGLGGPDSWGYPNPSADRSLAQMAGAQVADAWLS